MRPMSLSVTSPDRPASLSHDVLEEIENFLHSVVRYDIIIIYYNYPLLQFAKCCPILYFFDLDYQATDSDTVYMYMHLCVLPGLWNITYWCSFLKL